MAKIIAVCRSETKGIRKENVIKGFFKKDFGLIYDAHADSNIHRQVSLLAIESIYKMRRLGFNVHPGDFAENLTTKGLELVTLAPGTRLSIGKNVKLEISQIGKECHNRCIIRQQIGKCVMPKEGVFARVIHGGLVEVGDDIKVEPV